MPIDLPSFDRDGWELLPAGPTPVPDGAPADATTPAPPPPEVRADRQRGDVVGLVLAFRTGTGPEDVVTEQVWAMVATREQGRYLGLLLHDPTSIVVGPEVYLRGAAEIAFGPEHVVALQNTSEELIAVVLGEPPTRRWTDR